MSRSANKDAWKASSAKNIPLPEEIEKDNEIWLFEAPVNFDVSTLDGKKVNLADGHVVDPSDGVFLKQFLMDDYRLLTCKTERFVVPGDEKWRYKIPAGKLSIIDHLDQLNTEQVPSAVIARCPKLPTGLKERYRPFGVVDVSRKSGRVQKSSSKNDASQSTKHKHSARNSKN